MKRIMCVRYPTESRLQPKRIEFDAALRKRLLQWRGLDMCSKSLVTIAVINVQAQALVRIDSRLEAGEAYIGGA